MSNHPLALTGGEAIILSPGASVGSGGSTIHQRVADTNTQTLQPPRYTSTRTTGLVRCSEGEKNKEDDTEAMDSDLEVMDMEMEQDLPDKKEKRGRGRPPTTFEHVGKREKDEERARQKKEEELEKRSKEALSSNPPQGRKWEKAQDEVKEIEEELSKAPTADIAAQAIEQSVRVYKVADCSNKMKGSLVAQLCQAAMTNLAAVNVMAARARETSNEELAEIRCELEKLRTENQRLRREVEQLRECSQAATPSPLVSNPSGKVSLGAKRRKTYINLDTDSESEKRTESPPRQQQAREERFHQPALPPLKQYAAVLKEGKSNGHKEMEIDPPSSPSKPANTIMGPKVGGRAKPIPVEIPGMNEEEMQRYHILLEEMKSLQVTAAERGNAIPSRSMARPIPAKRSLVTGGR